MQRVRFDPKPLPPAWWLPVRHDALFHVHDFAPTCNESVVYARMGDFGDSNNQLQAWAHALEAVAPQQPAVTLVPSKRMNESFFPFFDVAASTRGWACVAPEAGAGAGFQLPGDKTFFLPQLPSGAQFVETVLAQLLLRPRPSVRDRVLRFEARFDPNVGYDALHLRSFESPGRCATRTGSWITPEALACQRVRRIGARDVRTDDLCRMTDEYLDAALAALGQARGARPLLVAHDGQNAPRVRQILQRFNGTEYAHRGFGKQTLFVEMLLMIRARSFIGNPGSTVSLNVARVRRHALGTDRATNIGWSCDGVNTGQKAFSARHMET